MINGNNIITNNNIINPLASLSAGAPSLKYRYVNTVIPSPGEVKGLIKQKNIYFYFIFN